MSIPSTYRETVSAQCGNKLVFVYNPFEQGCLWIFPVRDWEKLRDQVNGLSSLNAVHRNLQMKLVGAATVVECDSNGRLLVPASQRASAKIEKNAVLLGMGAKFELWSESAHQKQIAATIGEAEVTPDMMKLSL
ncbi:division/cell wall cluster transcriptional repressor MraZ [Ahniella affigens]|nr:division/cell wall cluster transcriptional repressor MraZ [Ahniella affigens]